LKYVHTVIDPLEAAWALSGAAAAVETDAPITTQLHTADASSFFPRVNVTLLTFLDSWLA
jgi:hypothetical protein